MAALSLALGLTGCPKNLPPPDTSSPPATPPGATDSPKADAPVAPTQPEPAAQDVAAAPAPVDESAPPSTVEQIADSQETLKVVVDKPGEGHAAYSETLRKLKSAIDADPNFVEAHYDKGMLHLQLGDLKEAEKSFRRVTQLRPQLGSGWAGLAETSRRSGDFNRALDVLAEGLKQIPGDPLLMNNRALVLRSMGKTSEAIEEIRSILKINAIDVNAYNNMGRAFLETGDYEMAQVVFLKALLTVPAAEGDAYIHHNLGLAYLGLKDARARDELEQALAIKPDLVEALIARAYLHLEVQDYAKAAELLRKAVALRPTETRARLDLGVALRGLKEFDAAEMQYLEALRAEPKNVQLLRNLGILLGDYKKEYARAIPVYQQLRDALPEGADRDKAERFIREAEVNLMREERRREQERVRAERERQRQAAEAGEAGSDGAQPVNAPAEVAPPSEGE